MEAKVTTTKKFGGKELTAVSPKSLDNMFATLSWLMLPLYECTAFLTNELKISPGGLCCSILRTTSWSPAYSIKIIQGLTDSVIIESSNSLLIPYTKEFGEWIGVKRMNLKSSNILGSTE